MCASSSLRGSRRRRRGRGGEQRLGRRRALDHGAAGRERAAQDDDAAVGRERLGARADDLAVAAPDALEVLAHRLAGGRERVELERVADLGHHRGHAAGLVEVLHQVLARGLEVGDERHLARELVEALERQVEAEAAGDRGQVDDRVRRAAERVQRRDRVVERRRREDLREPQVLAHHLHDAPARDVGERAAARVGGGDRRGAGQRRAERLGHRRSSCWRCPSCCSGRRSASSRPRSRGTPRRVISPRVRMSEMRQRSVPEPTSSSRQLAVQHRAAGHADRRQVDARRAHQLRRRRLVAAAQEHDAVERVGAQRLLDVHRHEVAPEHRRRLHHRLAERHRRELERQAAGLPDAALDVLGDDPQVRVAGRELAPRVADADHRAAVEDVGRIAAAVPAAVRERERVEPGEPRVRAQRAARSVRLRHPVVGTLPQLPSPLEEADPIATSRRMIAEPLPVEVDADAGAIGDGEEAVGVRLQVLIDDLARPAGVELVEELLDEEVRAAGRELQADRRADGPGRGVRGDGDVGGVGHRDHAARRPEAAEVHRVGLPDAHAAAAQERGEALRRREALAGRDRHRRVERDLDDGVGILMRHRLLEPERVRGRHPRRSGSPGRRRSGSGPRSGGRRAAPMASRTASMRSIASASSSGPTIREVGPKGSNLSAV